MRSSLRREPVVVAFVRSAVILAAAFGLNVDNALAETAMDWGSIALIVREIVSARGRVRPLSR